MLSRRRFLKITGSTAAAALTVGCGGGDGSSNTPPQDTTPGTLEGVRSNINHIVFTMQENRSFDHYFGRLPQYRAGRNLPGDVDGLPADAANPSFDGSGRVLPFHIQTMRHENLTPSWASTHRQWNRSDPSSSEGTLDGFVYSAAIYSRDRAAAGDPSSCDLDGTRAMGFYDERDLPYYYELASQFAISDRMFCSAMSATLTNRMYLLAASSFGRVHADHPAPQTVNAKTIFELLDEADVSWKIYLNDAKPPAFTYYSWFRGYERNVGKVVSAEQFFADAASGNLPQVAMIETGVDTGLDEHPLANIQRGAAYMARLFNALIQSPLWEESAMFLIYDEHGGFYDHVPPPPAVPPDDIEPILKEADVAGRFDRYGFRVPFIAVSPWVKKHYVSHQVADQTSILKFIEQRFDLPALTRRDAAAHDLLDMFDFSQMSWQTPPELPAQGTEGTEDFCNI